MKKNRCLGIRLPEHIHEKLDDIARTTRIRKGEIIERLITKTKIDRKHREFITICSSGDNNDLAD